MPKVTLLNTVRVKNPYTPLVELYDDNPGFQDALLPSSPSAWQAFVSATPFV